MSKIVMTIIWEEGADVKIALVEPQEVNALDLLAALNAAMNSVLLDQRQRLEEETNNEEENDE